MTPKKPRHEKFYCDRCGHEMRFDAIKTRMLRVPGLELHGEPIWKKYFTCSRRGCKAEYVMYYETPEIRDLLKKQQDQRYALSQIPLQGAGMTREAMMHAMERRRDLLSEKLAEVRLLVEGG